MCRLSGDQSEQSTLAWCPLSTRRSFRFGNVIGSSRSATLVTATDTTRTVRYGHTGVRRYATLHSRDTSFSFWRSSSSFCLSASTSRNSDSSVSSGEADAAAATAVSAAIPRALPCLSSLTHSRSRWRCIFHPAPRPCDARCTQTTHSNLFIVYSRSRSTNGNFYKVYLKRKKLQ